MLTIPRRQFLIGSALPALVGAMKARAAEPADIVVQDGAVQLRSDGLALSPADYARLLGRLRIPRNRGRRIFPPRRGRKPRGALCGAARQGHGGLSADRDARQPPGAPASRPRRTPRPGAAGKPCLQRRGRLRPAAQRPHAGSSRTWSGDVHPGHVEAELRRVETGRVHTAVGAISIELPVRRIMGEVFDFAEMQKIAAFARERRIGLHLDGARLFLASAYTGISPATCAALFDTVYVSLYKYFNAASGAILAGPRHLLENLYHERRMFGGGLQQVWPDAAVALHYLNGFPDRYARAVAAADALFVALGQHPRCQVARRPAGQCGAPARQGRRRRCATGASALPRHHDLAAAAVFRRGRRFCAADQREPAQTPGDANHSRVYGSVRIVRDEAGFRTRPGWATK